MLKLKLLFHSTISQLTPTACKLSQHFQISEKVYQKTIHGVIVNTLIEIKPRYAQPERFTTGFKLPWLGLYNNFRHFEKPFEDHVIYIGICNVDG